MIEGVPLYLFCSAFCLKVGNVFINEGINTFSGLSWTVLYRLNGTEMYHNATNATFRTCNNKDTDLDICVLQGSCLILLREKWCPSCFMLFIWKWLFSWQLVPWFRVRAFSLLMSLVSDETLSFASGRWERRLLFLSPSPSVIKYTDKMHYLFDMIFNTSTFLSFTVFSSLCWKNSM